MKRFLSTLAGAILILSASVVVVSADHKPGFEKKFFFPETWVYNYASQVKIFKEVRVDGSVWYSVQELPELKIRDFSFEPSTRQSYRDCDASDLPCRDLSLTWEFYNYLTGLKLQDQFGDWHMVRRIVVRTNSFPADESTAINISNLITHFVRSSGGSGIEFSFAPDSVYLEMYPGQDGTESEIRSLVIIAHYKHLIVTPRGPRPRPRPSPDDGRG